MFYGRTKKQATYSTCLDRGQYGEGLAADNCKLTIGCQVIALNWRHEKDGLDIVSVDAEVLVIAKVCARTADVLVGCYLSTDTHKKRVLQLGSKAYINQLQNLPKHVRFDVIDFSLSGEDEGDVRHYGYVTLFSKHYTTSNESKY